VTTVHIGPEVGFNVKVGWTINWALTVLPEYPVTVTVYVPNAPDAITNDPENEPVAPVAVHS
jgi:hypothetical protein